MEAIEYEKRIEETQDRMEQWMRRQRSLERASFDDLQPDIEVRDLRQRKPRYPRYASGIDRLDDVYGGFQGLTVLGGESGTGKSSLALGAALIAAQEGECVMYFDAENGEGLMGERIFRWYGATDYASRFPEISNVNFFYVPLLHGNTLRQMARKAVDLHTSYHSGVLLVLDSLTATSSPLAKDRDQDTLRSLDALVRWSDQVVRETCGEVKVLALSELNASKEIYGRRSLYTATMAVKLVHATDEEVATYGEDCVRIRIDKNRDGRGRVDLGPYLRNWKQTRFERLQ